MMEVLALLVPLVLFIAVCCTTAFLSRAWNNAKHEVKHLEGLIPSYEGFVEYWRGKNQNKHDKCLAKLIKYRQQLERARQRSWPFTIVSTQSIIDSVAPKQVAPERHPRQLASTAQDEAAKAADLELPTGVWTDLAAAWTTWADQDDAERPAEAAEQPVKRPTPPAGGGGAGHVPWVVERHLAPIDTVRGSSFRIYRAVCNYCGDAVEDTSKDSAIATMRTLHESCRQRSEPAKYYDLPQVKATAPPSDTVIVGDERMTLPPATTGYSTLIVYRNEDPSAGFWQSPEDPTRTNHWHVRRVIQVPAGTTSYQNLRLGDPDEVRTIARIDMPPNTSTVAPRQITDLRQG